MNAAAEREDYQTELAREIHDGIQHLLVTLGARLELAGRLVREATDRAVQILAQEREMVRASDELRYLVRRLRTDRQHADLASALRAQVGALSDRWPFVLEVEVPPTLPRLSPAAEHAMLRVIQPQNRHAVALPAEVLVRVPGGLHPLRPRRSGEFARTRHVPRQGRIRDDPPFGFQHLGQRNHLQRRS
jgi:signal transduction histidine kinase